MRPWRWTGAALVALLAGCGVFGDPEPSAQAAGGVEQLRVEVIETYPHDTGAFTQGLELHEGLLYEGTGQYGESDVRIVEPETGDLQQRVALPDTAFGEGLTLVGDRIWQITWQEQIAFLRDRSSLTELDQATYTGEGWGVCYDEGNDRLVMSDGTPTLTFRDPETFAPGETVTVTRNGEPLARINELECVGDRVWANVWQTDEIVCIDPATGQVEVVVDASGLLTEQERAAADVLNGIAAVPDSDTFMITGKLWPHLFLVRFVPAE